MRYARGFTLVEVVISIMLLGLIMFFLYGAIDNLSLSNAITRTKQAEQHRQSRNLSVLKEDLFNAHDINLTGSQDFSVVSVQTDHSLYGIFRPYVIWLVTNPDQHLIRLESANPITLPIGYATPNLPYMHVMKESVKKFRLYQGREKDTLLIYLQDKEDKPYVYELYKPVDTR